MEVQSKDFLLFLGSVAVLGTLATIWLPHWSGSLYVLIIVGYFFRGGWRYALAGGLVMAGVWLAAALFYDLPNEGVLASRVGMLFGMSRAGLWGLTALVGFILGSLGIAVGQTLAHLLPQRPPRWRERR
ncbi:MAG: hypothetical protein RMK19_01485 [Bacteroidia bacterium]|nr:hypothetical protein [Bacteroidia bacterium]MDW8014667.1 hypothetical protein [Bacteroidia bacterium]